MAAIPLTHIQNHLQEIYELDIDHNVNDYLVTCHQTAHRYGAPWSSIHAREQLLIRQDEDELLLSLYLHNGIISNLETVDNRLHLHHGNLEDFCLALEGISHFLYLIWNARYTRSVTILEMELQAEIDKFILLGMLLRQQRQPPAPGRIRDLLFESIRYHDHLQAEELQRYRDASAFAEKYCWYLESSFTLKQGRELQLLRELRRFYRLGLTGKLRRINYLH